jgi:hypothetical protein
MAWMSGGSLAAQGGASGLIGSWKSTGGVAFRFTQNEMSMYFNQTGNSVQNTEKIDVEGAPYYLVWTSSYKVEGSNLVLDANSLKPSKTAMLENCKALRAPENCRYIEKYQIVSVGPLVAHVVGLNSPSAPQLLLTRRAPLNEPKSEVVMGDPLKNVDLVKGKKYYSNNLQYYFEWQAADGNLCLRKADGGYIWGLDQGSYKKHSSIKILRLQPDGNFVARGGEGPGDFMWSPLNANNQNPPNSITGLRATDEGKLVLVQMNNRKVLWSVP